MIINNPWSKPQRQANFGENLATGLSNLADYKVNAMKSKQEQQQKSAFWQQAGLSPEFASALANQPEAVQKSFLDRLEGLQIPGGQQQTPQMQQESQSPQQGRVNQAAQPAKVQAEEKALRTLQYGQEAQQLGQMTGQTNQQQGQFPQTPPDLPSEAPEVQGLRLGANPLDRRQKEQFAHAEKLAEKKAERKEKHELTKYEREKYDKEQKESKEYLNKIYKKDQAVVQSDARLGKLENLNDEGKLDGALFSSGLNTLSHGLWGVGIDLKSLQSASTQEFDKISHDMLNGIQEIFGGRILQSEVDNYLKTLPSLSQSAEGKRAVIDNMKMFNEAKRLELSTAREVIKQNNNVVPPDLEMIVNQKIGPELDAWAERFKNQSHKPIEKKFDYLDLSSYINKGLGAVGL